MREGVILIMSSNGESEEIPSVTVGVAIEHEEMEVLETADGYKSSKESSNFAFINVINQTISSIDLQWEYSAAITVSSHEYVFKIIKMKARDLWEKIYW